MRCPTSPTQPCMQPPYHQPCLSYCCVHSISNDWASTEYHLICLLHLRNPSHSWDLVIGRANPDLSVSWWAPVAWGWWGWCKGGRSVWSCSSRRQRATVGGNHELFVESGCHKEEGAGFNDNRGGEEQGEIWDMPVGGNVVSTYWSWAAKYLIWEKTSSLQGQVWLVPVCLRCICRLGGIYCRARIVTNVVVRGLEWIWDLAWSAKTGNTELEEINSFSSGCIKLNQNPPHSLPESCHRWRWRRERDIQMSKRWSHAIDLVEKNTLYGVQTNISWEYERMIRMRMPSVRRMTASILGSRGAVGTAGRGLNREVHCLWGWTFRHLLRWHQKHPMMLIWSWQVSWGDWEIWCPHQRINDAFTVALWTMGLVKSSWSHINSNTYKEEVLQVGYLEKGDNFTILYQRWSKTSVNIKKKTHL